MKFPKIFLLLLLTLCMTLFGAAAESLPAEAPPVSIGEGAVCFPFSYRDLEGEEICYEVHTDGEFVGEALLQLGLIEGEEGPYGLYVHAVNGICHRWEQDGHYWAFYVNGEYAMSGVSTTPIRAGEAYAFIAE